MKEKYIFTKTNFFEKPINIIYEERIKKKGDKIKVDNILYEINSDQINKKIEENFNYFYCSYFYLFKLEGNFKGQKFSGKGATIYSTFIVNQEKMEENIFQDLEIKTKEKEANITYIEETRKWDYFKLTQKRKINIFQSETMYCDVQYLYEKDEKEKEIMIVKKFQEPNKFNSLIDFLFFDYELLDFLKNKISIYKVKNKVKGKITKRKEVIIYTVNNVEKNLYKITFDYKFCSNIPSFFYIDFLKNKKIPFVNEKKEVVITIDKKLKMVK